MVLIMTTFEIPHTFFVFYYTNLIFFYSTLFVNAVDKIIGDPSIVGTEQTISLHHLYFGMHSISDGDGICQSNQIHSSLSYHDQLGMKALLLDSTTTKILSMVYSQSQVLEQEVYLVEQLGKEHEPMRHLKAVVFIQPTESNVTFLKEELKHPRFGEYHIFFSNIVSHDILKSLGKADVQELVRQVQEYYADFMAINEDLYHLGLQGSLSLSSVSRNLNTVSLFDKNVCGILSCLLAFKKKPSQIRHQGTSELARRIASDVVGAVERDKIFEFRGQEGPLLLILDRKDDPITPLLTQWTYQVMVHELLDLKDNRVKLKNAPSVKNENGNLDEVVLSSTQDGFFARHRYANFGDLGSAVKELIDEYQKNSKVTNKIESIEDMQKFMESYTQLRSHSINVSKHVAILSELSRLIDVQQLLDVSCLEQEIACSNDHSTHKRLLLEKIANNKIRPENKLRLALLFIIRYESYNEVREIKARLLESKVADSQVIDAMLEYAGESKRAPGLFTQGSMTEKFTKVFTQQTGVVNVYTQHQPMLSGILDSIVKGKIKESSIPLLYSSTSNRPSEIFVYIVGGVTFEEAAKVAEFNVANPSMRVVLGGSCIHNSTSFLKEISENCSKL